MTEEMEKNGKKKSGVIKLIILLLVILGIFLIFQFTSLSISDFTPEKIKNFVLQFGLWAPIVFIVVYALRGVVLVIPVGVMSLAGGLIWGKWLGTVYILLGATGGFLSFIPGRQIFWPFIHRKS